MCEKVSINFQLENGKDNESERIQISLKCN